MRRLGDWVIGSTGEAWHRSRLGFFLVVAITLALPACDRRAETSGELHVTIKTDPKTLNPLMAEEEASDRIRYLTGGVLIRFNRKDQENQGELAESWNVDEGGRRITFNLRRGLKFSDGSDFSANDVVATIKAALDPNLHSPKGDPLRAGGNTEVHAVDRDKVVIQFEHPISGVERLFDEIAISPARMAGKADSSVVLGPFSVGEQRPGEYILLTRNPHYWKKDSAGHQLPYLNAIRLYVLSNRDTELIRFRRGDIQLIEDMPPDLFEQLRKEDPSAARDLGPSVESSEMWFNEVTRSPLPDYKKAWFRSRNFRHAISLAVNRSDLARVAFRGHAAPAMGILSPANRFWFDQDLQPITYDPATAIDLLKTDGFHKDGDVLKDKLGHSVNFSLITNAGNKPREQMATLIQQDLKGVGIEVNFVPLDFPSIIERLTRTFDYNACLLGFTNVDLDPNGQMNVWLSSADLHEWNPAEKKPETAWEAKIDTLMREQASTLDRRRRKVLFDQVQQIAAEENPTIHLVDKNALVAVSPKLKNADPVVLTPQTYWNAEYLWLEK